MTSLVRCILRQTPSVSLTARALSSSSVVRKGMTSALIRRRNGSQNTITDLVKDFYVREIKAYKAAPLAKDAHVGAVKDFSTPSPPQPPSLPVDLANELAAYDKAEPIELKGKAGSSHEGITNSSAAVEFLELLEADLPKEDAHH